MSGTGPLPGAGGNSRRTAPAAGDSELAYSEEDGRAAYLWPGRVDEHRFLDNFSFGGQGPNTLHSSAAVNGSWSGWVGSGVTIIH